MSSLSAVIFDLDGTLLDFEGISHTCLEKPLKKYLGENFTFTWELHSEIVGRRATGPLGWSNYVLNKLNLLDEVSPDDYAAEVDKALVDEYGRLTPMKGALDLVENFSARNIPLAIATSSTEKAFNKKMVPYKETILSKVKVVAVGDDPLVKKGKPAPDIFLLAAKRLNIPEENLENVLVFEDSPYGLQGAKAAGMKAVGLPDSRLFDQEKIQDKFSIADMVLSSIGEYNSACEKQIFRE
eukprot:maker-scaffold_1-snap-gene-10.34-mRNA-1 protein AED:0.01 eAED:0.01 QI:137/1/1/1/0.5/0.66/3/533/239